MVAMVVCLCVGGGGAAGSLKGGGRGRIQSV